MKTLHSITIATVPLPRRRRVPWHFIARRGRWNRGSEHRGSGHRGTK